jgi:hypothetical protein
MSNAAAIAEKRFVRSSLVRVRIVVAVGNQRRKALDILVGGFGRARDQRRRRRKSA